MSIKLRSQGLIQADGTVFQRTQYKVVSARHLIYPPEARLSTEELTLNLSLPDKGNPQARALAAMWRKAGFDTEQTIAAALNLIQREFSYTLTPPVLGMMSLMNFYFSPSAAFASTSPVALLFNARRWCARPRSGGLSRR